MRKSLLRRVRSDEGLTTAEYAVCTVAVCGVGGLLYRLLTSDWFQQLLVRIIERAFSVVFG